MQKIFSRYEKKYVLDKFQYNEFIKYIDIDIVPDNYYFETICNIYYDTDNCDLIRKSLEKPIYKEKFRLRGYGIPTLDSPVFFEIKKKYNGIVGKRREVFKLRDAYQFINKDGAKTQIEKEIKYGFKFYNLVPKLYLAYDRYSYCGKDDKNLRITFDINIRSRNYDLQLEKGDYGEKLFDKEMYIMEIKTLKGLPLLWTKKLSQLKIYQSSFSKYGEIFKKGMIKNV